MKIDFLSLGIKIAVYGYVAYAILSRFSGPIMRIYRALKDRRSK